MDVIRALNNNAVLCSDEHGGQTICLGKGLGFGRKLGDTIDAEQAEQVFRPSTVHPIANLTALLSEIPLELVTLASEIVSESQIRKDPELLTLGLADHISFALERAKGGLEVSYPLVWEVSTLYPQEYTLGKLALDRIEQLSGVRLHGDEAAAIAMHFINAQFAAGDMSKAEASTKGIANILALVSVELGRELPPDSTTVARFITHLRYLFVRLNAPTREPDAPLHSMLTALENDDPTAVKVARTVRSHLEGRGRAINDNELAYIALHIARLRNSLA